MLMLRIIFLHQLIQVSKKWSVDKTCVAWVVSVLKVIWIDNVVTLKWDKLCLTLRKKDLFKEIYLLHLFYQVRNLKWSVQTTSCLEVMYLLLRVLKLRTTAETQIFEKCLNWNEQGLQFWNLKPFQGLKVFKCILYRVFRYFSFFILA